MEIIVEKPNAQERKLAKLVFEAFQDARKLAKAKIVFNQGNKGTELPERAVLLLKEILLYMSEGRAIALVPSGSEISTQQAAAILGVSRPHFVKLLEQGQIPFRKVGTHRRVLLEDLKKYEQELKRERSKKMAFLTKQAQDLQLGYE